MKNIIRRGSIHRTRIHLMFLFFILLTSIAHADRNGGLVGWWKFDDNSGSTAADSSTPFSGTTNNGTLTNSPSWVTGHNGYALSFDGSSSYVDLGNTNNITGNITVSAWVYCLDGAPAAYPMIVDKDINIGYGIFLYKTTNQPSFRTSSGGITAQAASGLSTNQWYMLTGTYDGINLNIYVNGVLQNSVAGGAPGATSQPLEIGDYRAAGGDFFHGYIDDVRIYNRALTAGAVYDLYSSGSLVAWYKMDDNAANTTVTDSASINNGTAQQNTSNMSTTGKIGNALSFNGSSDYITIPDAAPLDMTSAVTVSCWAKKNNTNTVGQAVSKNDSIATTTPYEIQFWSDGKVYANFKTTAGFVGNLSYAYSANTWTHVVETYDGANAKLYVNGVLQGTVASAGTIIANAKSLYIGSSGGNGKFGGSIDDVRIYDRALSAAEVRNLFIYGDPRNSTTFN